MTFRDRARIQVNRRQPKRAWAALHLIKFSLVVVLAGCGGAGPSTPTVASLPASAPPATSVLLGASDIDRPLQPGSYRIEAPFDVRSRSAFRTSGRLKTFSEGDVSFQNTEAVDGGAWITIDRIDTVFDDPCHGGAITPPVPSTVDGLMTALTQMVGFTPGPISEVVIDGHAGKSVELRNAIDTQLADCRRGLMLPMWTISGGGHAETIGGSSENVWVIDVDDAPLLIDGTMFDGGSEAARAVIEQAVQSIRFGSAPPAPVPTVAEVEVSPGLVDIGGRSLFMHCRGTGSPTVVFLAGTRMDRTSMRAIENELANDSVRVCDYDRAGEGQSPAAPEEQNDLDVVDDLAAVLAAAEIAPPYVLVGHSLGGDQAWLFADRHPAGVAGFVIMNAGFFELDWDTLHDVWSDREIAEERAFSEAGLGSVKQAASPPDDMPYVVMMSTIAQCAHANDICGRIYPVYEAWAHELAGRTESGRFVSVEAGHEIYKSRPDMVVDEIRKLISKTD